MARRRAGIGAQGKAQAGSAKRGYRGGSQPLTRSNGGVQGGRCQRLINLGVTYPQGGWLRGQSSGLRTSSLSQNKPSERGWPDTQHASSIKSSPTFGAGSLTSDSPPEWQMQPPSGPHSLSLQAERANPFAQDQFEGPNEEPLALPVVPGAAREAQRRSQR